MLLTSSIVYGDITVKEVLTLTPTLSLEGRGSSECVI